MVLSVTTQWSCLTKATVIIFSQSCTAGTKRAREPSCWMTKQIDSKLLLTFKKFEQPNYQQNIAFANTIL